MTTLTDEDLYARGMETLLAAWEEYARGATAASLQRHPGVSAAVFPIDPERAVYNNVVLGHDLGPAERTEALDAMEAVYAEVGITRFAAWVHESDGAMRADLESRGYALEESTRAMGMSLEDVRLPRPHLELGSTDWAEYLRILELPADFLAGADQDAYDILVARLDGENVATAIAFDHEGDCGIYNVTTHDSARRQGIGTALTAIHLHDAIARGCETASLQSTDVAEGVYASVGFRDLGRILEFVPKL